MPRTFWTPYQIVLTLQNAQEKQGLPDTHFNSALYNRAHELFGSWDRVLRIAGLDQKRPWSKGRVVELLQKRFPQQASDVWDDLALTVAAARLFGDCDHALLAAGFHINRPHATSHWTAEQVKNRIRERFRAGLLLETAEQEDPELFHAACAHFGNWQQAVSATHFYHLRPAWSKSQIIQTLKALERNGDRLRAHDDHQLYAMCRKQFGTWRDALLAAGIKMRWGCGGMGRVNCRGIGRVRLPLGWGRISPKPSWIGCTMTLVILSGKNGRMRAGMLVGFGWWRRGYLQVAGWFATGCGRM